MVMTSRIGVIFLVGVLVFSGLPSTQAQLPCDQSAKSKLPFLPADIVLDYSGKTMKAEEIISKVCACSIYLSIFLFFFLPQARRRGGATSSFPPVFFFDFIKSFLFYS